MPRPKSTLWLCRHGETPWTLTGRHTGRTDIPLTPRGERQAEALGRRLSCRPFLLVLTSPLVRARRTCELAGYAAAAQLDADLQEWDYGSYEGLTTQEIRRRQPSWTVWNDGAPDGETPEAIARRADRIIARAERAGGDVALFGHGHLLRTLAARWLDLAPSGGALLALDTASVSLLGYERQQRVVQHWNEICHLEDE